MSDYVTSPCIRECSLNDNGICSGCFRTQREILDWLRMNKTQQLVTLQKCQLRQQQQPTLKQRLKQFIGLT